MLRQEMPAVVIGDDDLACYRRDGFAVAHGLFGADEVAGLRDHYMRLRAAGSYAGDSAGVEDPRGTPDPLQKYPRMIHMHRWDEVSLSTPQFWREWLTGTGNRARCGRPSGL